MKKIILYSSNQIKKVPLTGGIRRFLELANNLGKYCDLTVVTGDMNLELTEGTHHFSTNQQIVEKSEKSLALHNRKYLKQIKRDGYDWIIAFDVPPAVWLVLFRMPHLCLMVRKDLIGYEEIILNGQGKKGIIRWFKLFMYSIAELITLIHAERIIVQCEYDKNRLVTRHKLFSKSLNKKIDVQINNVNPSWAKASEEKKKDNSLFRIGTVNGFSDLRKGCDIFLEAISTIIDNGMPVEAYIAGDGNLLHQYVEKYKDYENIHFSGRVINPSDYIKQFDLAVVPSRADSCPNTVMEALLNSVPVIASNVGGIPEILEDNMALFDPTASSLSHMIKYYTDAEKLKELVGKQCERSKTLQFDWTKSIYSIICGRKSLKIHSSD